MVGTSRFPVCVVPRLRWRESKPESVMVIIGSKRMLNNAGIAKANISPSCSDLQSRLNRLLPFSMLWLDPESDAAPGLPDAEHQCCSRRHLDCLFWLVVRGLPWEVNPRPHICWTLHCWVPLEVNANRAHSCLLVMLHCWSLTGKHCMLVKVKPNQQSTTMIRSASFICHYWHKHCNVAIRWGWCRSMKRLCRLCWLLSISRNVLMQAIVALHQGRCRKGCHCKFLWHLSVWDARLTFYHCAFTSLQASG